jgi:urease accessory protein
MLSARSILHPSLVKPQSVIETLTLPHEERHKRKFTFTCDAGYEFLLDLDKAHHLREGEGCLLETGEVILIKAAQEPLLKLTTSSPARLLKLAWHIGNRHTPAEVLEEAIYIADDHVLAQMVKGLGVTVTNEIRAFNPEKGAYHSH